MSITYTHCSNLGGSHNALPDNSDVELNWTSNPKTITFKRYKKTDNSEVDNTTSFNVTVGFPNTFSGTISDWGLSISGFFLIVGSNQQIWGAIKRAHQNDGRGTEDDIGIFSGTHNPMHPHP